MKRVQMVRTPAAELAAAANVRKGQHPTACQQWQALHLEPCHHRDACEWSRAKGFSLEASTGEAQAAAPKLRRTAESS